MKIYVVNEGDTLQSIAERFQVSIERLAFDNEIQRQELVLGQALLILEPEQIYTIEKGDTLVGIAEQFGQTVIHLVRSNPYLLNETFLLPGRQIVITYKGTENREMDVFGYAYSFIKEAVLEETLLYIDELLPFSYGYNEDGSLIAMNDDRLLSEANRFGKRKRMVITPLDRNERFNNQLVIRLLGSSEVQDILLANILNIMEKKGYRALDIDFEFIPAPYREAYVAFIQKAANLLHNSGYEVSVAVPPKIADDQPGLLYEGIDYEGIGRVADTVFLMTYEWGYKYGPPMAVAPVPNVRRVLDYAVLVIPNDKIYMGIPNYAYDWSLPFERNVTEAETIGNVEAVRRAYQYQTEILYDETVKAPYYYYMKEGVKHVVWFEDVRSIREKYNLVAEYGFRGPGYWNLMREFRANWLYVAQITTNSIAQRKGDKVAYEQR